METKTFIVLTEGGEVERWNTTKEKIDVGDEAARLLCSDISLRATKVFEIKGCGDIGLSLTNANSYFAVLLPRLPLKAPFKMEDGVMTPRFGATKEPVMPLFWDVPKDMKLVMLVMLDRTRICDQWLFAFDGDKRAYRMPLGNLYDDGRLCNGDMLKTHTSALAAVTAEVEQLEKGQWNSDLDRCPEEAKKLFRFKPHNDKFEQLPCIGTWQECCEKISPAILKYIL